MEYNVEPLKTFMTSVMTGAGRATGYLHVYYLFLRRTGRFLQQFIEEMKQFIEEVMEDERDDERDDEGFYDFQRREE